MIKKILTVGPDDEICRIDSFLNQKFPGHSRTYFQYLLEKNRVKVNGKEVKKREKLSLKDVVEIDFEDKHGYDTSPQNIPLSILYEDDFLLVINKPQGLVVHPAPGHPTNTLVNALLYRYKELPGGDKLRPGIVHRLDKDTSGVLVIAKTPKAHIDLSKAFKEREVEKQYLAFCLGNPGNKTINQAIGRDKKNRKKFALDPEGKSAVSHIEVVEFKNGCSLVKIKPETGRTHQIRVHLQFTKCPIIGDPLYGSEKANLKLSLKGQYLHAHTLSFFHPFLGKKMVFTAPIPSHFTQLAQKLHFCSIE